jgi:STAS domain
VSATPSADIPQFEISPGPGLMTSTSCAGEVDMSHEGELRAELRAAVEADARGIVVDLTECEFIDSSAIRALLLSREEKSPDHRSESLAVAATERSDPPHPLGDGPRSGASDRADGRTGRSGALRLSSRLT